MNQSRAALAAIATLIPLAMIATVYTLAGRLYKIDKSRKRLQLLRPFTRFTNLLLGLLATGQKCQALSLPAWSHMIGCDTGNDWRNSVYNHPPLSATDVHHI
jgi:hypothetical protein